MIFEMFDWNTASRNKTEIIIDASSNDKIS